MLLRQDLALLQYGDKKEDELVVWLSHPFEVISERIASNSVVYVLKTKFGTITLTLNTPPGVVIDPSGFAQGEDNGARP